MIEIKNKTKERAILVAVNTGELNIDVVEEHLNELVELAVTADADTIFKITQDKRNIDSAFYVGKGKAEEIAQLAETNEIDVIIFDDDLSPMQVRNLEKLINRKIVDRSGLILHIFATRAKTKESRTQVELAQLQYMLPRLTRAWTHLSKQYGGINTKGPGETQIESDRRIIRDRISMLKEKLVKIEAQRETQSKGRNDFIRTALVGYTNAGKSTLFNLLTKAEVFAEDKLFATLDSTTRALDIEKHKVLLSDTVGFIRKLPPHLVASFKSTLKEVREADVILHVIDMSHPFYEDHIAVVEQTLKELGCEDKLQVKIFNKVDLVKDKSKIDFIKNRYLKNSVIISAARGLNIMALKEKIVSAIEESFIEEKIELDLNDSKNASRIYDLAEVINAKYDDDSIKITYRTNKENSEKIKKILYGG
ncbi:MAG: GTPase HflX [Syntrophothermus sp.]